MPRIFEYRKQLTTKTMTNAAITKTLKKLQEESEQYSLGFRRLHVLPKRVRRAFDLSANLETGWDSAKAHQRQKDFLGGMTDLEYIDWLKTV